MPRCDFDGCRKKLKLTDMKCVCCKTFCLEHRLPESHNCTYDFKKNKIVIEKVVCEKVKKI